MQVSERNDLITRRGARAGRLLAALLLVATLVLAFAQGGFGGAPGQRGQPGQQGQVPPGFPGGQGFGGETERLELVERFDADGSGFLEAEERAAAKEYLAEIGWSSGGRRGGGLGGGGTSGGSTGVSLTPEDVEVYADADFYDTDVVRTIFIELGFDDWEAEMEAFYNTDVELPATVTIDGVTYENVGLRFRGNSSYSMVSTGLKRPLRLKMDTVVSGQNVEGVRTIKLLNDINDASQIRTVLTSTILQDYIAVPRVNFVRVVINGEIWGIYQSQQNFNRDFLEDWYGESDGVRWEIGGSPNGQGGMLYLGDDPDLYRDVYEIQNRDTAASWSALTELFRVLTETPLDQLVEELEPMLDIDGVLRYLALDVALVNSDGFWTRASDYELYLDESGRFHMINHDINETMSSSSGFGPGFGGAGRRGEASGAASSGVNLNPLVGLTDASVPLRSRLLAVPELQKRYLEYMLDVAERWLDWETLGPIAEQYQALIDADMAVDTRALTSYEQFQGALADLEAFVTARREYLLATLPGLIEQIDVPAYQPTAASANTAPVAASTESAPGVPTTAATGNADAAEPQGGTAAETQSAPFEVLAERAYAEKDGPTGWHVTAGTGSVVTLADAAGAVTNAFAYGALGEGFGASKLDQCVPISAGQDLSIELSVMAATATSDASGVAVRVNPNFHDSLEACLGALAADSGASRLSGGRSDADIDHPFGSAGGQTWVRLDADLLPELSYAAADIPADATYLRLSVRARDRSGAEEAPTVLVSDVSVQQAGAELVVNGGFDQE